MRKNESKKTLLEMKKKNRTKILFYKCLGLQNTTENIKITKKNQSLIITS